MLRLHRVARSVFLSKSSLIMATPQAGFAGFCLVAWIKPKREMASLTLLEEYPLSERKSSASDRPSQNAFSAASSHPSTASRRPLKTLEIVRHQKDASQRPDRTDTFCQFVTGRHRDWELLHRALWCMIGMRRAGGRNTPIKKSITSR